MLSRVPPSADTASVPLGAERIDARLGGGLQRAALHEVFAAELEDASAAAAFAALIALRGSGGPLLWVRETRAAARAGRLHAPGLVELGLAPDRLFHVDAPDLIAALRAGADIVRCAGVGAVIIEAWGKAPALDLTASRRLAVAAARTGVMALLLRIDASPAPSAAHTRWQVAAAPSAALPADAPGHPAFAISLLRHRGGLSGFDARLEWDCDRLCFREPPLSGAGLPALAGGTGDAGGRRAA